MHGADSGNMTQRVLGAAASGAAAAKGAISGAIKGVTSKPRNALNPDPMEDGKDGVSITPGAEAVDIPVAVLCENDL